MYKEVLAIRSFRRLWFGQAISQLGDAFYYLVFMFMVNELTHRPEMVGFVGALEMLPYLLFSMVAGVAADRMDRRWLMLVSDLLSALLLFGFATVVYWFPQPPIAIVFVAATLLSTIRVFFSPAKSAAIPALVPPDRLMEANALSSATQSLMPLIGIALSASVLGAVYKLMPHVFFMAAIVLNAVSFAISAYYIILLPRIEPDRDAVATHPLADLADGVRFMWRSHVLKVVTMLTFFFQFVVAPFGVAYVAANSTWFAVEEFPGARHLAGALTALAEVVPGVGPASSAVVPSLVHGSYVVLALFELAFMVGMVAGSLWVGKLGLRRAGVAFSLGLGGIAITVVGMALCPFFWGWIFWNLVCGVLVPFASIPMGTYFQLIVPDAYRGRANSVTMVVSTMAMPAGMCLAGMAIEAFGLGGVFLIMGVGMFVVAGIGLLDRAFRTASIPSPTPQQM